MFLSRKWFRTALATSLLALLLSSCGLHRKKYENPISKDTKQPDKVLFDKAIGDMERGRYEVARLTLQTLMNTYDTSEYLAKAKLAYADSWYREGGTHGLAQAEAEYKDFILFYPTMPESAEAQEKVCMIHFRQMEKADRDMMQAQRGEDECRNLLVQFPNSKYAPEAQQRLREIQEVIAEGEMRRGEFYFKRGAYPAAASRLQGLTDQYPLYSAADKANLDLGDSLSKLGTRFRQQAGSAYARLVREYPLSRFVDDAKKRLQQMELPVPEADPVAYARMKYETENRSKKGVGSQAIGLIKHGPDVRMAAKSGTPAMTNLRPTIPVSVPAAAAGTAGGLSADVSVQQIGESSALDTKPDARQAPPTAASDGKGGTATPTAGSSAPTSGASSTAAPAATSGDQPAAAASTDPTTQSTGKKGKKKKKNQQAAN